MIFCVHEKTQWRVNREQRPLSHSEAPVGLPFAGHALLPGEAFIADFTEEVPSNTQVQNGKRLGCWQYCRGTACESQAHQAASETARSALASGVIRKILSSGVRCRQIQIARNTKAKPCGRPSPRKNLVTLPLWRCGKILS